MKAKYVTSFKLEPRANHNEVARNVSFKFLGFELDCDLGWADDDGGFEHFTVWLTLKCPWTQDEVFKHGPKGEYTGIKYPKWRQHYTLKLVHLILDVNGPNCKKPYGCDIVGVEWFGYATHCDDFVRFSIEKDEYGSPLRTRDGELIHE